MIERTDEQWRQLVMRLTRDCEAVYTQPELEGRLKAAAGSGRPMRIKLGLDPTAPDIHLGHTVVLRKVRQFQDLGHQAVIIIGDYTARIGDPSGVNKTRPVLFPPQIDANAQTYVDQAAKVLDTAPGKLEIRKNSEWLADLNLADILRLVSNMTVARMMERDTFERRFEANAPIGVHEFLYPLMQAYDSVAIQADVELGGADQTFNSLVGRDIQKAYGERPQIVMITPILAGLDGVEKMSKSKGNYIALTDDPGEMFGKAMSIPDELMDNYFTLLTERPREQIDALLDGGQTHPRDAKVTLAKDIVAEYHGLAAAEAAAAEFARVFSQHQVPTDMPELPVGGGRIGIVALMVAAGFAKSNGEARRLIKQNAVSLDGEKLTDADAEIRVADGQILRVGRRRFARIVVS